MSRSGFDCFMQDLIEHGATRMRVHDIKDDSCWPKDDSCWPRIAQETEITNCSSSVTANTYSSLSHRAITKMGIVLKL